MISCIYTILNTSNGLIYVGQTKDFRQRKWQHLCKLRLNKHPNNKLQNAFNKYGESSFEIDILQECSLDFLYSFENYWIQLLRSNDRDYGYNLASVNPSENKAIITIETRNKIAISNKGKLSGIKNPMYGKPSPIKGLKMSLETREKVSKSKMGNKNPNFGKIYSIEERERISKQKTGELHSLAKKVLCTETGLKWGCISDAAKYLNIPSSTLRSMLNGNRINKTTFRICEN